MAMMKMTGIGAANFHEFRDSVFEDVGHNIVFDTYLYGEAPNVACATGDPFLLHIKQVGISGLGHVLLPPVINTEGGPYSDPKYNQWKCRVRLHLIKPFKTGQVVKKHGLHVTDEFYALRSEVNIEYTPLFNCTECLLTLPFAQGVMFRKPTQNIDKLKHWMDLLWNEGLNAPDATLDDLQEKCDKFPNQQTAAELRLLRLNRELM